MARPWRIEIALHTSFWHPESMAAEKLINKVRVDRTEFSITTLAEAEKSDQDYWRSRTPEERLAALELSRQIAYGYDPTTRGLSRFFEVVEFTPR